MATLGDDERAVRLDREGHRIDDASRFRPDLDDFPHARLLLIDAEHGVRAAIEHEVLAGARLLEADRFAEPSSQVGGHRADRPQDVRPPRGETHTLPHCTCGVPLPSSRLPTRRCDAHASKPLPRTWFVPAFVTALMTAPAVRPNSASNWLVMTWNS